MKQESQRHFRAHHFWIITFSVVFSLCGIASAIGKETGSKNPAKKERMMTISQTAQKFVRAINAHNVQDIVALMSSDHVFIGSLGSRSTRPAIEAGWQ